MMKNWRTTAAVLLYDVVELIHTVPDFTALTWKEIGIRSAKAAVITLLGILSADAKPKAAQ